MHLRPEHENVTVIAGQIAKRIILNYIFGQTLMGHNILGKDFFFLQEFFHIHIT